MGNYWVMQWILANETKLKRLHIKTSNPLSVFTQLGQRAKPNWKHSLNNTPGVVPLLRHDDTRETV